MFSFLLVTSLLIKATTRRDSCASNIVCTVISYGICAFPGLFQAPTATHAHPWEEWQQDSFRIRDEKELSNPAPLQRIRTGEERSSENMASLFNTDLSECWVLPYDKLRHFQCRFPSEVFDFHTLHNLFRSLNCRCRKPFWEALQKKLNGSGLWFKIYSLKANNEKSQHTAVDVEVARFNKVSKNKKLKRKEERKRIQWKERLSEWQNRLCSTRLKDL